MANKYMIRQGEGLPLAINLGGDMSANRQCDEDIYIGHQGKFSASASWPATPQGGTNPTGAFVFQENSGNTEATWVTIKEMSLAEVVAAQPNGTADGGGFTIKNIRSTACRIRAKYVATSGGVGVVPLVEIY